MNIIGFAHVNPGNKGCISYNLVFSKSISWSEAIGHSYVLGANDIYEKVALMLRQIIQKAFKNAVPLPWPPTADDLDCSLTDANLPAELVKFLNYVLSGNTCPDKHDYNYKKNAIL